MVPRLLTVKRKRSVRIQPFIRNEFRESRKSSFFLFLSVFFLPSLETLSSGLEFHFREIRLCKVLTLWSKFVAAVCKFDRTRPKRMLTGTILTVQSVFVPAEQRNKTMCAYVHVTEDENEREREEEGWRIEKRYDQNTRNGQNRGRWNKRSNRVRRKDAQEGREETGWTRRARIEKDDGTVERRRKEGGMLWERENLASASSYANFFGYS